MDHALAEIQCFLGFLSQLRFEVCTRHVIYVQLCCHVLGHLRMCAAVQYSVYSVSWTSCTFVRDQLSTFFAGEDYTLVWKADTEDLPNRMNLSDLLFGGESPSPVSGN